MARRLTPSAGAHHEVARGRDRRPRALRVAATRSRTTPSKERVVGTRSVRAPRLPVRAVGHVRPAARNRTPGAGAPPCVRRCFRAGRTASPEPHHLALPGHQGLPGPAGDPGRLDRGLRGPGRHADTAHRDRQGDRDASGTRQEGHIPQNRPKPDHIGQRITGASSCRGRGVYLVRGQRRERCGRAVDLVQRERPGAEEAAPVVEDRRGPAVAHPGAVAVARRVARGAVDPPGGEVADPLDDAAAGGRCRPGATSRRWNELSFPWRERGLARATGAVRLPCAAHRDRLQVVEHRQVVVVGLAEPGGRGRSGRPRRTRSAAAVAPSARQRLLSPGLGGVVVQLHSVPLPAG